MKSIKILAVLSFAAILLSGCNLKLNVNSNGNTNELPQVSVEVTNTNQAVNQNTNTASTELSAEIVSATSGAISQIKNTVSGEVIIDNVSQLCGQDVVSYAKPKSDLLIVAPLNLGSDVPVKELDALNLSAKTCVKLNSSAELSDFGARVLSPDQTKLAVALETNEAKELKLIDLINDTSKVLVTLPEDETLNGGYGALSDHFDIKWTDSETLQYVVYKDTVKNYDVNAPTALEAVSQVRVVKAE